MTTEGPSESPNAQPFFRTRGVVLIPEDFTLNNWPERVKHAGLNTIALHPTPGKVMRWVTSEPGQAFLTQCRERDIEVEYELHAMGDLLPRDLFEKDKTLFRMNRNGERTPDHNLCVHSRQALAVVAENAVSVGETLRPTTNRYFYWGDDNRPWCRCPECKGLSDSDQALLLSNHILEALRKVDPKSQLAHLAYANTLEPPTRVAPHPGIFLEFAPIGRDYNVPIAAQDDTENRRHLELLDANLALFNPDTAQVLEYWLDVSRFSKWKRPAIKLPWSDTVFAADVDTYGGRGIRHITTFACYIDADYLAMYGEPPLDEYGTRLRTWPGNQR